MLVFSLQPSKNCLWQMEMAEMQMRQTFFLFFFLFSFFCGNEVGRTVAKVKITQRNVGQLCPFRDFPCLSHSFL